MLCRLPAAPFEPVLLKYAGPACQPRVKARPPDEAAAAPQRSEGSKAVAATLSELALLALDLGDVLGHRRVLGLALEHLQ